MKNKILLSLSLLGLSLGSYAQNIDDALRYSQSDILGTARYTAMSGAFGALGGDMSAIADNPAASAVFLNSTFDFSLMVGDKQSKTNFNTSRQDKNYTDWKISNLGMVQVFNNYGSNESGWNKGAWGINYKANNAYGYNSSIFGVNDYSLAHYFADIAQGIDIDLLNLRSDESISSLYKYLGENYGRDAQTAFLGYQAYIIDPATSDLHNTEYVANVTGNAFNQHKTYRERGYNGVVNANFSGQYENNLYVGINLNAHVMDYKETKVFQEAPQDQDNSPVTYMAFVERLKTTGNGFSAQVGAIYRFDNGMRIGATYTSPQWLRIEEETQQAVETDYYDSNGSLTTAIINPHVVNIYESYTLRIPAKLGLSFAYVIGQTGLISFEYDYTDNSNMVFKPRSYPYFGRQNDIMKDRLQASSSFKVGGEYNVDFVSFRAGYHFQQTPYKDSNIMGDKKGYSVGLGLAFDDFKLDFAYLYSQQESNHLMLSTNSSSYLLDKRQHNFITSLSFSF